ncbi:MAG: tRNA pseudouridine(38-40) synthase TruA [Sphingobacteriaceae bacterium]|nr:tRNA pseudouridine(38-40) synthase TruA [Sphingobacteriaceae bacterium]
MSRYFLTLSYQGKDYNGWQIQDNTPNTIQQVLEEKISMLLNENIEITGCGRTDTGVNAQNYVAHFNCRKVELIENKNHWIYKFNTVLPPSIAISNIRKVKEEAHARFDAQKRVYYYYLHQLKNPFIENKSWYLYGELDFELMNRAAVLLFQYEDFSCFSKANTQTKTNNCKIYKAKWQKVGDAEWRFTIAADRFLRGMVRAIVGTLILIGRNKITLSEFKAIIESKDRKNAGASAPAHALYLSGVQYPNHIFID